MNAKDPLVHALVMDRDGQTRRTLQGVLKTAGFHVISPESADALSYIEGVDIALAVIDMDAGIDVLDQPIVRSALEIVLMSQHDNPDQVNAAMSRGATYFFCKPIEKDFIAELASDVIEDIRQSKQSRAPVDHGLEQFGLLRGDSPAMRKMYRTIRKVAPLDTTVFLSGESGSGKDLVAQTLHMMSARSRDNFVAVSCAAIPRASFESELFGHEQGTSSTAIAQHIGYFERAGGGTLFLDEITEMPGELQATLLRVLETNAWRRVGGDTDVPLDVRVIASSNRRPQDAIEAGVLRQDLFFRLARFQLNIPPLRQRGSDIGGLARFFLYQLNQRYGGNKQITDDAIEVISRYPWPGNVRELCSVIERAYIVNRGRITAASLGELTNRPRFPGDLVEIPKTATIAEAEKALILASLAEHGGNKSRTAQSLGISLKTLYNRLQEYRYRDTAAAAD